MAYLSAPILDIQLPAFQWYEEGSIIKIPYSLPLGVSENSYNSIRCYLYDEYGKNIANTKVTKESGGISEHEVSLGFTNAVIGNFYKIRIAFIDVNNAEGQLSTIAIVKCTDYNTKNNDNIVSFNRGNYTFTITYVPPATDLIENAIKYNITIYTDNTYTTPLESSGEQLYLLDSNNTYQLSKGYAYGDTSYGLAVEIWTKNLYYKKFLRTVRIETVLNSFTPSIFEVATNSNDGEIIITAAVNSSDMMSLYLKRREISSVHWDLLKTIRLNKIPTTFKDLTIEQGKTYYYGLQRYAGTSVSPIYSSVQDHKATANFEDLFLVGNDGRQLKIRFNPQVNTFKTTQLEQKVDTLGSKFPYIFRNGDIEYKEFSLSGLISYKMDDNAQFFNIGQNVTHDKRSKTNSNETFDNELNDQYLERLFKLEVEQWLRNGQPKLMRSPTEGNYIITLMNVSLTPNEQLGRLLHTFNATAYEIADYTSENLQKYNFI